MGVKPKGDLKWISPSKNLLKQVCIEFLLYDDIGVYEARDALLHCAINVCGVCSQYISTSGNWYEYTLRDVPEMINTYIGKTTSASI
jgi:hypothetical protein